MGTPRRIYSFVNGDEKSPDYDRVVQALPDADLEDEILAKLGDPDYQAALIREHERRATLTRKETSGGR